MQTLNYRADIDGLRAIAVLAIIIYHANASWLPGGVASLGIFFVISGFLITSIIHKEILGEKFSFTQFYTRRIKRILPLFYTVIFATALISFFLFSPKEYLEFGKSVRYAIFFMANMYFSREQDYFAPDAEEVPLLHLWTLSVEEQYYMVWPALLLLLRKKLPNYLLMTCLLVCAASFTLATVWAADKGSAALSYYSLPTRFGEFLIGSLLALHPPKNLVALRANIASIIGLALIAGALMLLNDNAIYPGYNALWSCIGTALLIYSGSAVQQPSINKMLALRPVVFIGLISYSLYLWHWPILAYARYYTMSSELPLPWIAACFLGTFSLSYLTWRFIEQPARLQKLSFKQACLRFFVIPTSILVVLCIFIKTSHGYLLRDRDQGLDTIESPSLVCHNDFKEQCHAGAKGVPAKVLIVGDSHTAHLATFFDLLGQQQGWASDILSVDSCPPLTQTSLDSLSNSKQRQRCAKLIEYMQSSADHYNSVIYSLRWDLHFGHNTFSSYTPATNFSEQLEHDIQNLLAKNKKVFLVGQVPLYKKNVARLYRTSGTKNAVNDSYEKANNILRALAKKYDHVYYIDTASAAREWHNGIINGLPAYKDENHLNVYGQKELVRNIQAFAWIKTAIRNTEN